jgi:hypothetical protein
MNPEVATDADTSRRNLSRHGADLDRETKVRLAHRNE